MPELLLAENPTEHQAAKPKKLHVTFVRAPIVSAAGSINNEATPCIAFAYIAGYILKHGYRVDIVDGIAEGLNEVWALEKYPGYICHGLNFDEIISRIPLHADVIAFSGMFSGEWPILRDLITKVRQRFPHALFVAGGEHITGLPEYSLRDCPALDACVRGEGEYTFYELLESYSQNGDYSNIQGVSYIDDAGVYRENNASERIRDAGTIPWPYWPDGYMEKFWAAGKSYGVSTGRDMPFMSSRGCPYRCTFCSNPQMWTTRYVLRDPEDCVQEIKHYIARYNITSLQFYDLTAITKKGWILEFCNKLMEHGVNLTWSLPSGTRSEVLDEETLSLIRKTGCSYLVYAPESGSAETLKAIKKQIKLPKLEQSVCTAMKVGIGVRTNLIIGFPSETPWNILQTLLWGLKMAIKGADEVPINIYSPYPGSEIFQQLNAAGKVKLCDDYFMRLTSLNAKYFFNKNLISYNPYFSARQLVIIRNVFMMSNYLLSYLCYPSRIVRTIRNLFTQDAATVFEHRIKDAFKRRFMREEGVLPADDAKAPETSRETKSPIEA